jgi:xylulokinase
LNQAADPEDIYQAFDHLAAEAPAGSRGVIFTPWLNGERAPVDDHTVRGGFHNLSLQHTRTDLIRAAFEGVAYNSRWLLGSVEKFVGRQFPSINIVGGGAKSDIWCQIFADVLERPIRQMVDPIQTNSRGAAILAGVAMGATTFDQMAGQVAVKHVFQPNSANRALYGQLFKEFLIIYKNNRQIYNRLNGH